MSIKRISPYPLRLSNNLRKWMQMMANKNERSLNSEIKIALKEYRLKNEQKGQA